VSMWRRTLVYLGLVEEPDEHDEYAEPIPAAVDHEVPETVQDPVPAPQLQQPTNVRRLAPVTEPGGAHVRPMAAGLGARVQVVAVVTFDEGAAEIARQYRMGAPVLFDMTDADPATARRVLDFVSGVTFALRGRMSKVASRAFLVVPEGVELSTTERERLASLGYGGGA